MRTKFIAAFLILFSGCSTSSLLGLPGPQDGTWLASSTTIGFGSYILGISHDQIVRVNINGSEWTVQQSFAADRSTTNITWKTIATPPAGSLVSTNVEYDLTATVQANGSMTGTLSQGISTIPGIASIPTGSNPVTLTKI